MKTIEAPSNVLTWLEQLNYSENKEVIIKKEIKNLNRPQATWLMLSKILTTESEKSFDGKNKENKNYFTPFLNTPSFSFCSPYD